MHKIKIKNMDDFAKVCGVSRPTISKFFYDPHSIRKSIKNKIELSLEKYDYYPNFYAINQNRELTKNIGIVVPYLADPFFAEIARNLERKCITAGYTPTLFSSHGEQALENNILDTLRSLKPAGVLFAPLGRYSDKMKIEKFCKNVPTILFDSNIEDLGAAFVGSENYKRLFSNQRIRGPLQLVTKWTFQFATFTVFLAFVVGLLLSITLNNTLT